MTDRHGGPHVGFKLPNCGGVMCEVEWATPETVLDLAGLARQLEYDSVWLHDHTVTPRELQHLGEPPFYEPLVVMAAVAAEVTDITIGVATLILPFRDPVILYKQIVTLDRFFPNRFVIGLGLGQYESEFESFGVETYRSRGKVANEYLEVMRALSEPAGASLDGAFRSVRDARVYPKMNFPAQPPIWVGGNSVPAMNRALRHGRGWIFSGALSPDGLQSQLGAAPAPAAPFGVVLTATVVRADDSPGSTDDGSHRIHQHASAITGTAEEVANQMHEYSSAGVTHFLLTFRSADLSEVRDQMAWFAADVRPRLITPSSAESRA